MNIYYKILKIWLKTVGEYKSVTDTIYSLNNIFARVK